MGNPLEAFGFPFGKNKQETALSSLKEKSGRVTMAFADLQKAGELLLSKQTDRNTYNEIDVRLGSIKDLARNFEQEIAQQPGQSRAENKTATLHNRAYEAGSLREDLARHMNALYEICNVSESIDFSGNPDNTQGSYKQTHPELHVYAHAMSELQSAVQGYLKKYHEVFPEGTPHPDHSAN